MLQPTLPCRIAAAGDALATLTVSPAVAKATVYMPSQVAARMLGDTPVKNVGRMIDFAAAGTDHTVPDTSHAA